MSENTVQDHPGVTKLADYGAGLLRTDEAESVRRHLTGCPVCRLETKRIARFGSIETDDGLAAQSGWPRARIMLEDSFRRGVLPAIRRAEAGGPTRGRLFQLNWIAPLFAAAAVIILFVCVERSRVPFSPSPELGPVRGGGSPVYGIALVAPLGDLDGFPKEFVWNTDEETDYFTLEVFTSNLGTVYREEQITGSSWSSPDSLLLLLEPGTVYLWSVWGRRGLDRVVSSPHAWFRISGN